MTFKSPQNGFTYIGVLLMIALSGVGLATVGVVWHTENKREKEKELLFIGKQFSKAIESYTQSSVGATQYPSTLNDLIIDRRLPIKKRHLRKIFRDPMTDSFEWGLQKEKGRIVGVYSKSSGKPLTKVFETEFESFKGAKTYSEWIFMPS